MISRLKSSIRNGCSSVGLQQEVVQDPQALVAVGHLRVELDAEEAVVPLQRHRRAVLVGGQHLALLRQVLHGVRVAHPDLRLRAETPS